MPAVAWSVARSPRDEDGRAFDKAFLEADQRKIRIAKWVDIRDRPDRDLRGQLEELGGILSCEV